MIMASLPVFPPPSICAGDFNCQHTSWGYWNDSGNGNCLIQWANLNDLSLLYDPKKPCSFHSSRWNTRMNLDLAFTSHTKGHLLDRHVLGKFPKSQRWQLLILTRQLNQPTPSKPVWCWNFHKANWEQYCLITEAIKGLPPPDSNDVNQACQAFCDLLISAAKKTIPCRYRKTYIPCWDEECNSFYHALQHTALATEIRLASKKSFSRLDQKRQSHWAEAVGNIDFMHSSRKAWKTVNQLTGRSASPHKCPILANSIPFQLVNNGVFKNKDHKFTRLVVKEVSDRWRAQSMDLNLSGDFATEELYSALQQLKAWKAAGPDNICPELILHASDKLIAWLCNFLSSCLYYLWIPKIWRRAIVIATPKPNKPLNNAKSCHPISLLYVPFKILEHLIHSGIEPVIDSHYLLSRPIFIVVGQQRTKWPCWPNTSRIALRPKREQVLYLSTLKLLTTPCGTVASPAKLLHLLPDKHMVQMIMELVLNCSFVLKTDGQQSRLRRLKNGVPQGSVLALLLFNISTYNLPNTTARCLCRRPGNNAHSVQLARSRGVEPGHGKTVWLPHEMEFEVQWKKRVSA